MKSVQSFPIERVVSDGYCIGCGACAVVDDGLSMKLDRYGLFKPEGPFTRVAEANAVCPFSVTCNEDSIGMELFGNDEGVDYDPHVGYYRGVFVGHVSLGKYRDRGGSSGFVTWLLAQLLNRGLIDGVIHLKPSFDAKDALFEYAISSTVEEILAGAKSKYYPSHFDEVVRSIKGNGKRYAFVGVPCYIKAIKLLGKADEVLSSQIAYCIALFCGHMKSVAYSEFIAGQLGIAPERIKAIDFRVKDPTRPANRYSVSVQGEHRGKVVTRTESVSNLYGMDWGLGYFKPKACDWCDDIVGELADVSSGDAWLPGYVKDPGGNNIVIVRSPEIHEIISSGIEHGELSFSNGTVEDVVLSQSGNYRHRREGLGIRIEAAERNKEWYPKKRTALLESTGVTAARRKLYEQRSRMSGMSHDVFLKSGKNPLVFAVKMIPQEIYYYHLSGRLFKGVAKVIVGISRLLYRLVRYRVVS